MARYPDLRSRMQAIEKSIGKIEAASDPATHAAARELLQLVMQLHEDGFARLLELLRCGGEEGSRWIAKISRDDLLSNLLALHSLHPLPVETRVARCLEELGPSLEKYDAKIQLVSVDNGIPRLRLHANRNRPALRKMVEEAIFEAAPDVVSLMMEDAQRVSGFVPIAMLRRAGAGSEP